MSFSSVVYGEYKNFCFAHFTYDHRLVKTGHPVRSAILKHQIGRSVVEWVTISESLLLYVSCIFLSSGIRRCGGCGEVLMTALEFGWSGVAVAALRPGIRNTILTSRTNGKVPCWTDSQV